MALDGRILARARERYNAEKKAREELLERRTREVYEKAPHIRETDAAPRSAENPLPRTR